MGLHSTLLFGGDNPVLLCFSVHPCYFSEIKGFNMDSCSSSERDSSTNPFGKLPLRFFKYLLNTNMKKANSFVPRIP